MGAFLRVRVIYCELRQLLKSQQIDNVYGAVLNGENLYSEPLKNGLIVIGNEANGINECNLEFVNKPITIPSHQSNGTESLNAAMASAIIASEFYKKNRLK
jgi:TrmH family RNA methyltransferase